MIRKGLNYLAAILLGVVIGVFLAAAVGVNKPSVGDRWLIAVVLSDEGEPVTKFNWHELVQLKGKPGEAPSAEAE